MKLIVSGSRTFWDYPRVCEVLNEHRRQITEVLTGGARGADRLGYRWAVAHGFGKKHRLFKADWDQYGKSAGYRRNYVMARAGDVLVAFWDGQSPGTKHMIQCMEELGKPVVVIGASS